jgi:vancomycin permeability regulator SanA
MAVYIPSPIPTVKGNRCVIVIMGAAVWPGGEPSRAMRRRVSGALATAGHCPESLFIVSGAVGKHPPSEARAMATLLLQAGIPETHIVLDEASADTLQSVLNCMRLIRSVPSPREIIVCSDTYHMPRCRWLFRLCNILAAAGDVKNGRAETPLPRWIFYLLREVLALPWDTFLLLAAQRRQN